MPTLFSPTWLPRPWRAVLAALVLALAALTPAQAQDGLRVVALRTPEFTFGGPATFAILAAGDADITDVTLLLRTPDEPRTFVGKARFTKGQRVEAVYVLEPGRRRLAAFSPVEYWWELRDAAGNLLETEHQTFTYSDNRFTWQTLSEGGLTVAWYAGDRDFARQALDIAAEGLTRANRVIQAPLPETVTLYLYASAEDAQLAVAEGNRLWADARANPLFGIVIVALPPDAVDTPTQMARAIPHELTHILIAQKTGDRFPLVPNWLQEGLAVMNEAAPDAVAAAALADASAADRLLPLAALCGPFSQDAATAQLAYAQSESVTRYIHDRFGARALETLLTGYADGLACESGVQQALGVSLATLEADWRRDKVDANPDTLPLRLFAPWLILGGLVLAGPLLLLALTHGAARPKRMV